NRIYIEDGSGIEREFYNKGMDFEIDRKWPLDGFLNGVWSYFRIIGVPQQKISEISNEMIENPNILFKQ
ncbi:hypothetical protein HON22_00595, partial [Candidatus Peregrinibacteria bacterium]|nr:hypothetical protein [Candidatus Peregrinibacteria bacterium]